MSIKKPRKLENPSASQPASNSVSILKGSVQAFALSLFLLADTKLPESDVKPVSTATPIARSKKTVAPHQQSAENELERLDALIKESFTGLENLINAYAVDNPAVNPALKEEVMSVLKVLDMNKFNPLLNYQRFIASNPHKKVRNLYHCFIKFSENSPHAAYYIPPQKLMGLSENFNPQALDHLLVFFHEWKHVIHDGNKRRGLRSRAAYENYLRLANYLNLNEEANAYSIEIEFLNVILGGRLKTSILSGNTISLQEIKTMHTLADDSLMQAILQFAEVYYKAGVAFNHGFHPRFISAIYHGMIQSGHRPENMVLQGPDGSLHKAVIR